METYNYREEMISDIIDYIRENNIDFMNIEEAEIDTLREQLWVCDSVTGNASGSYWFSTWKAEEAICHNWDLLREALVDFGYDRDAQTNLINKGAEWADVTIRCNLLGECLDTAIQRMKQTEMATCEHLKQEIEKILGDMGLSVRHNPVIKLTEIIIEGIISPKEVELINKQVELHYGEHINCIEAENERLHLY